MGVINFVSHQGVNSKTVTHVSGTDLAPICPHAEGIASTITVAATASVARSRSGASKRIIPSTACATTATAAIFRPCSQPEPPASPTTLKP